MNPPPDFGSFWERLVGGRRWTWLAERYRADLPANLADAAMALESRDRFHAKQGRSTARIVFHTPAGPLSVYLKRHYRLPRRAGIAALVHPRGRHSPGAAELAHLERVRSLGIAVPEAVAAGERIGPWGALQSFLMVAELVGALPLHEAIPHLATTWSRDAFAAWKRGLARELAAITATLHRARLFHKDLYLCHFFLDMARPGEPGRRLTLIDLHRLGEHRAWPDRWRRKDLGQLLYSTLDVLGIDDRDRLRFWRHYRRGLPLPRPRRHLMRIRRKAAWYLQHNRP